MALLSYSTPSGRQFHSTRSRTVSPPIGSIKLNRQAWLGLPQKKVVPLVFKEPLEDQEASPVLGTLAQPRSDGKRKKGAKQSSATTIPEVFEEL